ncbi:PTS sugar transporter subunit IIA [bacterium]|nr:PTS sugar transporter subunit IIA [bacterium]
MKISEILNESRIKVNFKSKNKSDAIKEMVGVLENSDSVLNNEEVLNSVLSREKAMTTGIGNGIAIPHGKSNYVKDMVASLGIVKEGIPFDSIDGKPVNIIFTLISPSRFSGPHIKALSLVSRLLNNEKTRKKILECTTPREVFSLLKKEESKN